VIEAAPQVEVVCDGKPSRLRPCPSSCPAASHFDEQLRLASQVQRDLLPDPMPVSASARFHALFLPADHVSGDIYDVVRLDESRLAISLADATGHGLPAALLTVLIKRSFRGKTIENGSYRIMEPDEVLRNMNREFLDMNLSHCQFVTGLHAIYDEQRRCIRWGRGGLPHPVFVRPDAEPRFVRSTGVLVGAVESPVFDVVEQPLQPGDQVYFYTDGLEALLCRRRAGENPFDISSSPWFRALPGRNPADALAEVAEIRRTTPPDAWPFDDITVVCIECSG
jgi:sigma-B regulation protein RsbU (phosphoserine phosphatase)